MSQEIPVIHYNASGSAAVVEAQWWIAPEEELHKHIIPCARAIDDRQNDRRLKNVRHARLYGNSLQGLDSNIYQPPKTRSVGDARLTLNVIKSAIDTASAKIAKNRPRPLFLTDRGDWSQRQRAKKLTQYVAGVFKDASIYTHAQRVFRDCGIFGTGFLKLDASYESQRILAERVIPSEILVDDAEGVYGTPRTLYQRAYRARGVVQQLWGDTEERKKAIDACAASGGEKDKPEVSAQGDMLCVVEAWHLPSGPKSKDGKHAICIENVTLFSEEYKKDYFPIIPMYWTPPVIGYYGTGIAEEITGIQLEINKLLRDIQEAQHKVAAPSIWLEATTHVQKPITNQIGSINRYTGQPPQFYAPRAFSNEIYEHVWNLNRKAFEIVGVSEMAATLKKPAGLESRAALREYHDIETERFALVAQDWEQFFMRIAEIVVDLSRDLFEKDNKLSINAPGKKFIDSIKWEDVDLEKDTYVMDVFPTGILPSLPAGKFERVVEMIQGGMIDKEYGMALLDFPDVEEVVSLETASYNCISMIIGQILDEGIYQPPDQFIDLSLAIRMGQTSYLRAKVEGAPEDRLELLRTFVKQALLLQSAGAEAPPAMPQAPGAAPMGPGQSNGMPPSTVPPGMPLPGPQGMQ